MATNSDVIGVAVALGDAWRHAVAGRAGGSLADRTRDAEAHSAMWRLVDKVALAFGTSVPAFNKVEFFRTVWAARDGEL